MSEGLCLRHDTQPVDFVFFAQKNYFSENSILPKSTLFVFPLALKLQSKYANTKRDRQAWQREAAKGMKRGDMAHASHTIRQSFLSAGVERQCMRIEIDIARSSRCATC